MKALLIIAIVFFSFSSFAQKISFDKASVTYRAGKNTSLDQDFDFVSTLIPARYFYFDRYIVKNGVTYYRPCIGFLRKPKTYIVDNSGNIQPI